MIITRRNDDDDDHRHHSSAQIAAGGCGFTCWPRWRLETSLRSLLTWLICSEAYFMAASSIWHQWHGHPTTRKTWREPMRRPISPTGHWCLSSISAAAYLGRTQQVPKWNSGASLMSASVLHGRFALKQSTWLNRQPLAPPSPTGSRRNVPITSCDWPLETIGHRNSPQSFNRRPASNSSPHWH